MLMNIRTDLIFKHYVCVEMITKANLIKLITRDSINFYKFMLLSAQLIRGASKSILQDI